MGTGAWTKPRSPYSRMMSVWSWLRGAVRSEGWSVLTCSAPSTVTHSPVVWQAWVGPLSEALVHIIYPTGQSIPEASFASLQAKPRNTGRATLNGRQINIEFKKQCPLSQLSFHNDWGNYEPTRNSHFRVHAWRLWPMKGRVSTTHEVGTQNSWKEQPLFRHLTLLYGYIQTCVLCISSIHAKSPAGGGANEMMLSPCDAWL